jgi:hypothetical protein
MDFYEPDTSEPGARYVEVRLLGTGAAVPTLERGQAIQIARTGVGTYTLTTNENLGKYMGNVLGFDATTASGLAGFSAVLTQTSQLVYTVSVFNGSNAAADLAAAQWLNLTLKFKGEAN